MQPVAANAKAPTTESFRNLGAGMSFMDILLCS
jgi:hypothetical protein